MPSTNDSLPDIFLIVLMVLGFVVLQALLSLASAWFSGWLTLSRYFRAHAEPTPQERIGLPIWIRMPRSLFARRLVLRICFVPTHAGLYLSAGITNCIGRPPLHVPWKQVHLGRPEETGRSLAELILGDKNPMLLRIKEGLRREIALWKSRAGH